MKHFIHRSDEEFSVFYEEYLERCVFGNVYTHVYMEDGEVCVEFIEPKDIHEIVKEPS